MAKYQVYMTFIFIIIDIFSFQFSDVVERGAFRPHCPEKAITLRRQNLARSLQQLHQL